MLEAVLCGNTLLRVLQYLSADDLARNCSTVCKRWSCAVKDAFVWSGKVHNGLLRLAVPTGITAPQLYAAVYRRSLILNANLLERQNKLKDGAVAWRSGDAPFAWELPLLDSCSDHPQNLSPLPVAGAAFHTGALAFPEPWTEAVQVVDVRAALRSSGLPAATQEGAFAAGAPIGISFWVTARPGYTSRFQLVMLALTDTASTELVPWLGGAQNLHRLPKLLLDYGARLPEAVGGSQQQQAAGAGMVLAQAAADGAQALLPANAASAASPNMTVLGPLDAPQGQWQKVKCRLNMRPGDLPSHVIIAIRGSALPGQRQPAAAPLAGVGAAPGSPATSTTTTSTAALVTATNARRSKSAIVRGVASRVRPNAAAAAANQGPIGPKVAGISLRFIPEEQEAAFPACH